MTLYFDLLAILFPFPFPFPQGSLRVGGGGRHQYNSVIFNGYSAGDAKLGKNLKEALVYLRSAIFRIYLIGKAGAKMTSERRGIVVRNVMLRSGRFSVFPT